MIACNNWSKQKHVMKDKEWTFCFESIKKEKCLSKFEVPGWSLRSQQIYLHSLIANSHRSHLDADDCSLSSGRISCRLYSWIWKHRAPSRHLTQKRHVPRLQDLKLRGLRTDIAAGQVRHGRHGPSCYQNSPNSIIVQQKYWRPRNMRSVNPERWLKWQM